MLDLARAQKLVNEIKELLSPQVDYAELVGAEGFAHGQYYVWEDPEPYIMNEAAKTLEEFLILHPVKQYETVYYILGNRVWVGWYLAKVGETSHLILQDKIEMGICWVTDGLWFLEDEEANEALRNMKEGENAIKVNVWEKTTDCGIRSQY